MDQQCSIFQEGIEAKGERKGQKNSKRKYHSNYSNGRDVIFSNKMDYYNSDNQTQRQLAEILSR